MSNGFSAAVQPLHNITQCPLCGEITENITDELQLARSEVVPVYHPRCLVSVKRLEDGELFWLPADRDVPKGFVLSKD